MYEHPFMMDLVLVPLLLPVLEAAILGRNYRVLSPVTMWCACFFTLYMMPYLVHFYIEPDYNLKRLGPDQFALAFRLLRELLLTFTFCSIPLLFILRNRQSGVLLISQPALAKRLGWVVGLFIVITVLFLGVGVKFSPSLMWDIAINPRAHTDLKAGLGPAIHIQSGAKFALLVVSAAWVFVSGKSLGSILLFGFSVILAIVGGTKSSIVQPFIILTIIWQQCSWKVGNPLRKLWQTMLVAGGAAVLVIAGFAVMRPDESAGFMDALREVPSYHKEAFYLPLVVTDFPYTPQYAYTMFLDTLISPLPRAFWPTKPSLSLWELYFRPTYEPNTVYYHTSTFGCLAEAHMLFNFLGPFIYGAIWAFIVYKLYSYMLQARTVYKAFVVGTFSFWMYLLLRTSFLGVNFWIMTIYMVLGWLFLRRLEVPSEPGHDQPMLAYSYEREQEYARYATF